MISIKHKKSNLQKNILFVSILFLYLFSNLTLVFAQELTVEKHIKETATILEGEKVTVMLKITNPFNTDIPIKIIDKNIFANNGLDIQCLEQTIPKQTTVELEYTPITAYVKGDYTLDKAKITYNDPTTNTSIDIESNTHKIKIEKGTTSTSTIQQGITTINKCDGKNSQSTSYSSQSNNQQQNQKQQQPQNEKQQQKTQDKLNNINQENAQNMQNLQKEMQQEVQKQEQQKKEMEQQIESNKEMYDEHKKLEENGYKLSEKNINPQENNSGDFEYKYQKENGDKASITGNINNKSIENISSFSSDDERRLMKALENNTDFKEAKNSLEKDGFKLKNKSITPTTTNMTNYNYQFSNPANNETAQIYGNITRDENVTSIIVEKQNNNKFPWYLIYLATLLIAGYYYWSKYIKKPITTEPITEPPKKPINYHKKALSMLTLAEKTYKIGNKKEAYEKASYAVRYFYKHKFELGNKDSTKKELNSTEVINISSKKDTKNKTKLREFFNTTNMVNFAKYKPNDKDFNKILAIGNGVIKK